MIHKKIVQQKIKEYEIQDYVKENLKGVGLSRTKLQITPLGEKVVISASRPGLIVGRKGQSIKKLTNDLKREFKLENPQIEIDEVKDVRQDPMIVAETIASYLERFGVGRFKSIGHKVLEEAMQSGALGIEILISGKVPSSRSKTWRFYKGYLKKCGDLSITGVRKAYRTAHIKTGAIGIQVRIMPADIALPDQLTVMDEPETVVSEVEPEKKENKKRSAKKTSSGSGKEQEEKPEDKTSEASSDSGSKEDSRKENEN